jgi:hypothetical protein
MCNPADIAVGTLTVATVPARTTNDVLVTRIS